MKQKAEYGDNARRAGGGTSCVRNGSSLLRHEIARSIWNKNVTCSVTTLFKPVRASIWCTWWRSWNRYCATTRKAAGSFEFFIGIILPAALWPWGRLTSNRNEYQEYFLEGKGRRYIGLTTLPS